MILSGLSIQAGSLSTTIERSLQVQQTTLKMAVNKLKLATYNSTGSGRDKQLFIHNLLCTDIDILFLQEHWLHKPNLTELNDIHSNFSSVGASGMDSRKLGTVGRPYGGSAILFNKLLSDQIVPCKSNFKNTCGLLLNKLLLI